MTWWMWCIAAAPVIFVGAVLVGKWLKSCSGKDICDHNLTTRPRWSQDGWAAKCYLCDEIVYFGDDYEGGPDARGVVSAR